MLELVTGEDTFLGVGEARILLAGDDVLLVASGEERLRGAGLDVLEFGLI